LQRLDSFEERARGRDAEASALAMVEPARPGTAGPRFEAGVRSNIITASFLAVPGAAGRLGVAAADLAGEVSSPPRTA
jgi:hypothetical protein